MLEGGTLNLGLKTLGADGEGEVDAEGVEEGADTEGGADMEC